MQGSGQLVPVERRSLSEAHRQLPVTPRPAAEEQHCAGAVHRLHRPWPAVNLELEHEVLVLREVARRVPGLVVVDQRRTDLVVAALQVLPTADVLELVPEDHALRVPER